MTQFASDSFTGPDGVLLSTNSPSWTRASGAGNMALLGNRVRQSGSTAAVYVFTEAPAPSADYDVSANIYFGSTDGAPSVGVCGRMVGIDALTFYQARIVIGSGVVLARFINGTTVSLATVPYNPVLGSSPKLTLRQRGDQLSVLLDDALFIGPITDTNITGAGYAGIRAASSSGTSVHLDNFSADTADAPPIAVNGNAVAGGVASSAQVGTGTASGGSRAAVTGPVASGNVGSAIARGGASASAAGVATTASVGAVTATGGSASVASPLGVAATALTGGVDAQGGAKAQPGGTAASAQVGQASASAGLNGATTLAGVSAVASVGAAIASGNIAIPVAGEIDATKVPAARTVKFEGGIRTVAFKGGIRTVLFTGGTRIVRF